MATINLLPQELRPKGMVLKASLTLKKVARFSVVIFLVFAMVLTGVFFVLSSQVKQSTDEQEGLKIQMKALEETEQRLFLLKDRLGKVEGAMSVNSAKEEIEVFEDVLGMNRNGVEFGQVTIEKDKVNISMSIENADSITGFFNELVEKGNFKTIKLLSLQSNTEKGYSMELSLVR